ncbi:MAG: VTT domain-containing protein, partial [Phycisphaerales bacterium]|nr:VTT domain-containing protein [Phycisphaerales bacterium]
TWGGIVEALAERLREPEGPEVVLILPYGCPGTLQAAAMDPRRDELLEELRAADAGNRLGVYWPTLAAGSTEDVFARSVYVHAKAMIVDDRLLRVGSANLSNRSMGVDSELDVFVQVGAGDDDAVAAIAATRRRLLGYLLGVRPDHIAARERERGTVVAAIESLRGGERTLQPFEHRADKLARTLSPPLDLADPARPISEESAKRLLAMIQDDAGLADRARRRLNVLIGLGRRSAWAIWLVGIGLAIVMLWTLTPLSEWADRETLAQLAETVRSSDLGVAGVVVGFVVLASVGMPVMVLVAVTGSIFGIWHTLPICLVGVIAAALIDFGIGRLLPFGTGGSRAASRLRRVGRHFANRGVLAMAVLRNLPIAPFAVVNIACGMSSVRWWTYLLGTVIGMLPGIVLIGLFGRRIGALVFEPTATGLLQLLGLAALVIGAAVGADAALRRWGPATRDEPDDPENADADPQADVQRRWRRAGAVRVERTQRTIEPTGK